MPTFDRHSSRHPAPKRWSPLMPDDDRVVVLLENALKKEKPVPTGDPRHNINIRRNQLLNEVVRHRHKLEAAEKHLERLRGIPDRDPFENGQVLRFRRGGMRFVALRAGTYWYTTGTKMGQPQRATWVEFVDWLVSGNVAEVEVMVGTGPAPLADLGTPASPPVAAVDETAGVYDPPEHALLPFRECTSNHTPIPRPHAWHAGADPNDGWYWCRGLMKVACSYADVEDHAPHEWTSRGEQVWCRGA